ncbi:MAG: zf-HC2 domain-containing protein [Blautia sp.]|uniref:zf-HC2 domain-containing protein n=1 Tax=Blautia sp. TaxID=1955243 RepID=UPI002E77F8F9|nr:zf-HC2 domain-containing protein [Blautia sp.]MEE1443402.1 zf-HC2 domain-containing protein [Blautia sp.]
MKEISCNIIRDILPLYVDEAVCEETKELVEEHLFTCEDCRKEAEMMKKSVVLPVHENVWKLEQAALKTWKNKWLTKKVKIGVLSVLATLGVLAGIYSGLVLPELCIPYDSSTFSLKEEDGNLYVEYTGDDFGGTVGINPISVEKDGKTHNVVCFYYYDNPWTRYIKPHISSEKENFDRMLLGKTAEIEEVYYGEFDLMELKKDETSFEERLAEELDSMEEIYKIK